MPALLTRSLIGLVVLLAALAGVAVAAPGSKPFTRVTGDLTALHGAHAAALAAGVPFRAASPLLAVAGDHVTIDATASGDAGRLQAELTALGARDVVAVGRMVSARLPIPAIPALDRLAGLQFARPAYRTTSAGLVTSQGDRAMRADVARTTLGVEGTGVTVGVLSDSFNCLGGAPADVSSGDLSPVTVLQEIAGCAGATDEGRAMLQIVHDVAPGSSLAFASAFNGQASFAANIQALAAAGARVIVDDVFYFAEPLFQDGIIAQAVDGVAASGVAYFSAAGNSARQAYDHAFVAGTTYPAGALGNAAFKGGTAHDFAPGGAEDNFQKVTIPAGRTVGLSLQWDSPFFSVSGSPGTATDLDVYVLSDPPTTVLFGVTTDNLVSRDPVEVLFLQCSGTATCAANLMIVKYAGPNPGRIKYVAQQAPGLSVTEHATNSGAIYGHANAAGAIAVGAAFYGQTPAFGIAPAVLESFSSRGTTPVLFSPGGAPAFDARAGKPEIVAPDGGDTTFFGIDAEPNGRPNFFGTSAAAPHAAGVAALMLDARPGLTPAEIRAGLRGTALDMGPAGFDNDSGSGLVQADAAVASLHFLSITAGPGGAPNPVASGGTVSVGVAALDSAGHAVSHAWDASCPTLAGHGVFGDAAAASTVWTAPPNPSGSAQACTLSVTVSDGHGLTRTASYLQGVAPSGVPTLSSSLNATAFGPGDTMIVTVTMTPGPGPVDAFVVIELPAGTFVSYTPAGWVPGIAPAATEFTPIAVTVELARHTFTGGEPAGAFRWFTALVDSVTGVVVGAVDQDDFVVTE
ncbi:MAG: S8 family peptidase [Candidatus Rokuibacteriota bacterium]